MIVLGEGLQRTEPPLSASTDFRTTESAPAMASKEKGYGIVVGDAPEETQWCMVAGKSTPPVPSLHFPELTEELL